MTLVHRARLAAATLIAAAGALTCTARPAYAQAEGEFAALLTDAGVNLDELASLADATGELTAEQIDLVHQALFRLGELEQGQLRGVTRDSAVLLDKLPDYGDVPPLSAGALVRFDGVVVTRDRVGSPPESDATLWRYRIALPSGRTIVAVSPHAPRPWDDRSRLREPVTGLGVYAGGATDEDRTRPVVLVNRFRWFPVSGVPSGVAWLATNGFDAALLEDVRPVSAFGKPHESREAEAFYTALATVARGDGDELRRLAQQEVHDAVGRWRELAEKESAEEDASNLNARIAGAVARSAERGVSSVGPMYLAPADTMGRLVLIEGVARRAVRIVVDDAAAPADLLEYIELDLFTADSENLPVICAVARLPAGFPTGDRINEPVRVTGVFLKRWAYVARPDADEGEAAQRMAAPLVLAAEPQWLRTADAASATGQGVWFGLAFVAVLGLIWLAVALAGRSDRLARSRRTSYDADLGVGIGPPPADQ